MQVRQCRLVPPRAKLTPTNPPSTASLELKATKEKTHKGYVTSVGYNSDGDKIVSGGQDGTLKVWDGALTPLPIPHLAQTRVPPRFATVSELKAMKQSADSNMRSVVCVANEACVALLKPKRKSPTTSAEVAKKHFRYRETLAREQAPLKKKTCGRPPKDHEGQTMIWQGTTEEGRWVRHR